MARATATATATAAASAIRRNLFYMFVPILILFYFAIVMFESGFCNSQNSAKIWQSLLHLQKRMNWTYSWRAFAWLGCHCEKRTSLMILHSSSAAKSKETSTWQGSFIFFIFATCCTYCCLQPKAAFAVGGCMLSVCILHRCCASPN